MATDQPPQGIERLASALMAANQEPTPITDLATLLSTLTVSQRPGEFCMATVPTTTPLGDGVEALMVEDEGVTAISTTSRAEAEGWDYEFPCAWLTLDVYSALEAVGLTAAVAKVLTEAEIPCNVIAARHHDHILVPTARVTEAAEVIELLARE